MPKLPMNELAISKDLRPVLMRSGLVHWVAPVTTERIRALLASQTGHSFIAITELGITINTADVSGVYTLAEYEDLTKIRQGMFQCAYKNWHKKKGECECKEEAIKKQKDEIKAKEAAFENRVLTPEEKQVLAQNTLLMEERWALKGSYLGRALFKVGNRMGRRMRLSTIAEWEAEHGPANLEGILVEVPLTERIEEILGEPNLQTETLPENK